MSAAAREARFMQAAGMASQLGSVGLGRYTAAGKASIARTKKIRHTYPKSLASPSRRTTQKRRRNVDRRQARAETDYTQQMQMIIQLLFMMWMFPRR